uniref:Uncharacterized protein n=1 Tax=Glossina austeni TaxID=7395 RepID=A0A1A9UYK4_GLOAU
MENDLRDYELSFIADVSAFLLSCSSSSGSSSSSSSSSSGSRVGCLGNANVATKNHSSVADLLEHSEAYGLHHGGSHDNDDDTDDDDEMLVVAVAGYVRDARCKRSLYADYQLKY